MKTRRPHLLILVVLTVSTPSSAQRSISEFDVFEKSVLEIHAALRDERVTSVELVRQYLDRIEAFDKAGPRLNSIVYVNPNALSRAQALDDERRSGGMRGMLHGIPVLLKDNYDTADMPTSAGSIALAGSHAPDDGYQVRRLRDAGAVVLGKTNMHELARGITTVGSLAGQTRNPYAPDRNPGGSSGGTGAAVAASFAAVGMGSDTCGSIRIPSANHNLFGLRVTQGLSSRDGIVPLSLTQDVGGPLARTIVDLAIVLDATVGYDASDRQTELARSLEIGSFQGQLDANALAGARLGLLTNYLRDEPREREVTALVRAAAKEMENLGAELVDISVDDLEERLEDSGVISHEFKFHLKDYLATRPEAPVSSLGDVLDSGLYHVALESGFTSSNEIDQKDGFKAAYAAALEKRAALTDYLDALLQEHRLDALVYPTLREPIARIGERQFGGTCSLSANSGLPALTMPAGFTKNDTPVGIELLGKRFDDARLVSFAYAYEQAVKPRRAPFRTPALTTPSRHTYLCRGAFNSGNNGENKRPFEAELQLELATQTLSFELSLPEEQRLTSIRLHRGHEGAAGPVLQVLPTGPTGLTGLTRKTGAVEVANATRLALTHDNTYLAISTPVEPQQAARCEIRKR